MPSKLIFASLVAALVMALAANGASARNLSISHGELFNIIWRRLAFNASGFNVWECDVTFEGSFHYRTMAKIREALVGYVTRPTINNCNGRVTVLTTNLPWHIRYESFDGTLPNMISIRLRLLLFEFRTELFGGQCLARTSAMEPMTGSVRLSTGSSRRLMTGFSLDEAARIFCIVFGVFTGTAQMAELPGGTTNLLVRLI
jgi:hypothetical protein